MDKFISYRCEILRLISRLYVTRLFLPSSLRQSLIDVFPPFFIRNHDQEGEAEFEKIKGLLHARLRMQYDGGLEGFKQHYYYDVVRISW
jgi:hypothetical protein